MSARVLHMPATSTRPENKWCHFCGIEPRKIGCDYCLLCDFWVNYPKPVQIARRRVRWWKLFGFVVMLGSVALMIVGLLWLLGWL